MGTKPFRRAREDYESGVPLGSLQRRYKLSEGELRDVAPEEFIEDHIQPTGGY